MSSYKVYPEYRDSGVEWLGSIPRKWKSSCLRWYISIASGEGLSNNDFEKQKDETYLYRVIGGNGTLGYSPYLNTTRKAFAIGRVGALCGNVHFVNEQSWITDNALKISEWREFDDKYLFYLLTSAQLNQYASKTAQPLITGEQVKALQVIFPSKVEQQQISSFLDHETAKIDTLIEKQQQLIKLLREKRQAVISHAVTKGLNPDVAMKDSGVEWLGEVPEHWICCTLKHISQIIDCKHLTAEFFDDGIPLASISEVKGWFVNLDTAKLTNQKYYSELIEGGRKPQNGDIIFSRNVTVGEAAFVPEDILRFAMGQDVCLIRSDNTIFPEYILYVIKSKIIIQQLDLTMMGSTFKRINVDDIRKFSLAKPPFEEQIEIVKELKRVTDKYDLLIDMAKSSIILMQERRTALISAAVTGKIDVRDWKKPGGFS